MEFSGAADVAVPEMVESHSRLDQPLIILPRRPPILGPELFPNLMALVVVARVEVGNSLQIEPFVPVFRRFAAHAWLPVMDPAQPSCQAISLIRLRRLRPGES